jgi:hypothetical protein
MYIAAIVGLARQRSVISLSAAVWLASLSVNGTFAGRFLPDQNPNGVRADPPAPGRPGSISGRITIQGNFAPGIPVALHPRHEKTIATSSTDAEGRYRFNDVPPGHYRIEVPQREYVTADGNRYEDPGRDVSLPDGAVLSDADVELIRGAVVSGRIVDTEGRPVSIEHVYLIPVTQYGPGRELYLVGNDREAFNTDSDGRYRIYGISPGRYLVATGVDIPRVTGEVVEKNDFGGAMGTVTGDHYYAQTFYPGTTDQQGANILDLTAGSELTGLDITLGKRYRAFTASGRVIEAETGRPITNCHIELGHKSTRSQRSTYASNRPSDTDSEGRFSVGGLVPGNFFANAQFEGPTDFYSTTPVWFEVNDDDVRGLELKVLRGVILKGTVSVEGAKMAELASKLAALKLEAKQSRGQEGIPLTRVGTVAANGSFEITGLRPGSQEISIGSCDVSEYFSLAGIEYPEDASGVPTKVFPSVDRFLITVGNAGLTGLRVTLGYNSGRIRIHADVENGRLPAGVRLMAWVSGGDFGTALPELDSNGDCTKEGLAPGEYRIQIGDSSRRFTEEKVVKVAKGSEARVSFVVDASKISPRN